MSGWKAICQSDSQLYKLLRSSYNFVQSEELWIAKYRRVSSAKKSHRAVGDILRKVIYINEKQNWSKNRALRNTRKYRDWRRGFPFKDNSLWPPAEKWIYPTKCVSLNPIWWKFVQESVMSEYIKRLDKAHHHTIILDAFLHVGSDIMNKFDKLSFTAMLSTEAMLQWVKNIVLFKMLHETTTDNVF